MSVKITKDGVPAMLAAVRALTRDHILIGIPDTNAEREPEPGEEKPASNALIGYVQEFGSPEHNIPARPFLVPGVEGIKDKAIERLKKAGIAALSGDLKQIVKEQMAVGLIAQSAVQTKITDGPFVPLAPRTIQERLRRGRTGTRPLIDTGQLRRSITYVIRPKKGK